MGVFLFYTVAGFSVQFILIYDGWWVFHAAQEINKQMFFVPKLQIIHEICMEGSFVDFQQLIT